MAKIVIVEDEQTIREELASLLTQTGYSVSYLTEFQHATEDILERNPDLILMDVNLPGTNGLILCDQIRNVYCTIKIPKVAEDNPKSCMRIFPIIADVLVFLYDHSKYCSFREISKHPLQAYRALCILEMSLQTTF